MQALSHVDAAQRQFTLSKQLITILRHTAPQHGITLRSEGYYSSRDILALPCFRNCSCSLDDLREIVANDSKGRFQISQEGPQVLIRATRGHSLRNVCDDELYTQINIDDEDFPTTLVHCTYERNIEPIRKHGLFAGGWRRHRKHIYFSPFLPTDSRGYYGRRTNFDAVIYVDVESACRDGVPFLRGANQVIVSDCLSWNEWKHSTALHPCYSAPYFLIALVCLA